MFRLICLVLVACLASSSLVASPASQTPDEQKKLEEMKKQEERKRAEEAKRRQGEKKVDDNKQREEEKRRIKEEMKRKGVGKTKLPQDPNSYWVQVQVEGMENPKNHPALKKYFSVVPGVSEVIVDVKTGVKLKVNSGVKMTRASLSNAVDKKFRVKSAEVSGLHGTIRRSGSGNAVLMTASPGGRTYYLLEMAKGSGLDRLPGGSRVVVSGSLEERSTGRRSDACIVVKTAELVKASAGKGRDPREAPKKRDPKKLPAPKPGDGRG